jgi:hypothetical protein
LLGLTCSALLCADPKLKKLVVVGDSLAAGFENFSLVDVQQVHSFANVIAQQANTPLTLPLVPCPGIPNDLYLAGFAGFLPIVQPLPGVVPFLRDNPNEHVTNLAVPGQTLSQALNDVPTGNPNDFLTFVVLGIPPQSMPMSQMQTAVSLKPSTLIVWIGNNDALLPALTGNLNALTPLNKFAADYTTLLQTLHSQTSAAIVTANIPDVTEAPFFTPVAAFAQLVNVPVTTVAIALGVSPFDYLRPGALPIAAAILSGAQKGPLPANCPSPLAALTPNPIPCVLTAAQALQVQLTILAYNGVIAVDSAIYDASMVDMHSYLENLHNNGVTVGGMHLTSQFLGGLVSLDGVHPTNTLHALIANQFIKVMNQELGASIPPVSVRQVEKSDPLIPGQLATVCPI